MNNPVNWFEIPCINLERAKEFYTNIFGREFQLIEMPDSKMYMFSGGSELKGATGAIVESAQSIPSDKGITIYFECADVENEAAKVENSGGKLLFSKTSIGQFGFIAQFIDTEGNKIGLHSHS